MNPAYREGPTGKRPHFTRSDLKKWLRRHGFRDQRIYKCQECEMFHTTTRQDMEATGRHRENDRKQG